MVVRMPPLATQRVTSRPTLSSPPWGWNTWSRLSVKTLAAWGTMTLRAVSAIRSLAFTFRRSGM